MQPLLCKVCRDETAVWGEGSDAVSSVVALYQFSLSTNLTFTGDIFKKLPRQVCCMNINMLHEYKYAFNTVHVKTVTNLAWGWSDVRDGSHAHIVLQGVIVLISSTFPIKKELDNFPLCLTEYGASLDFPQQKPNFTGHKVDGNVLLEHAGASQKIAGICWAWFFLTVEHGLWTQKHTHHVCALSFAFINCKYPLLFTGEVCVRFIPLG